MKKSIFIFASAILAVTAFVSCNKENAIDSPKPIKVNVSTEIPTDPQTKVSIVEAGSQFSLNWEGTESFVVCNSSNTNGSKKDNTFSISSHTGTNAVFTGTLPSVTGSTTNYMAAFNWVSSTASNCRAEIPGTQAYSAGGALATNCLLVARTDDATVGTLNTLSFKTMNAFMKFSLKKGSAAAGSSNTYTKMYVQNIKVETIADGEAIAGRYGFAKTGTWDSAYAETIDAEKKSVVTLNCVTGALTNGVELDPSTATDFYVAIAFGTYTKGLRVTISVKNESGDYGEYVRTISNGSSYNVDRNTLIAMPAVVVNPDDVSVDTYTLIDNFSNLTTGEYIMCAVKDGYQAFTGTLTSYQCVTETVTYTPATKSLDFNNAVTVTLTSTGTANQYKISWERSSTTYYLKSSRNDRLAEDSNAANAEGWTASAGTSSGIFLTGSVNSGVIKSATSASSRYIRSYSSTNTIEVGVVFFKKD